MAILAAICCCLLPYAPKSVPEGSQNDNPGTQNDSKIDPKSTKIGSWGSLGTPRAQLSPIFHSQGQLWSPFWESRGSKMIPKLTKNRLKLALGAPWAPPEPNWVLIFTPKVNFGAHFGSPGGPKIDQKSQLALKILIWRRIFHRVSCPCCFEQLLTSFLH